jgi:hypothetical protein
MALPVTRLLRWQLAGKFMTDTINSTARVVGGATPAAMRFAGRYALGFLALLSSVAVPAIAQSASEVPAQSAAVARSFLLPARPNDLPLFAATSNASLKRLSISSELRVSASPQVVEIHGRSQGKTQSFTITSGAKPWDLSRYLYLLADIHNSGTHDLTIITRVEDPEYAGWHHYSESVARIAAGQSASVLVFLKRKHAPEESVQELFPGMHALPNGYMPIWSGLDPARITRVVFTLASAGDGVRLELRGLRASGICDPAPLKSPDYFPFIDAYGQFRHAGWPTKIHAAGDFENQRRAEAAALRADPRPENWNQYGGFKAGPQLAATGHFRVEKHAGKWWLVDPEGRLFWSHGVTGVGFSAVTPVPGRRRFFAELPASADANPKTVNFYLANLKLKYGDNAEGRVAALSHERLHHWGLNTLASWSDAAVTDLDRTPYTKTLHIGAPKLAPSLKLPDPFDDAFARNAQQAFEVERATTGTDPWCIGYFIANELEWRGGPDLVNEILTASAEQAGKQALVKMLQKRHATVAALNTAWRTSYGSWSDLLAATNKVDAQAALADFTAFNEALAERYYATCQTELKRATPNKLNLGSRFHTVNPIAVRAAARYCDVVSFNKYATSIRNIELPGGLDRPIIIGEFHFAAWDRSFTAAGDRSGLSQVQRADAYWYYVTGALENPLVVGTHWFQYLDQPLTGRSDGENWAIGFVDVTDSPYEALTKVTREVGATLYERRLGLSPAAAGKPEMASRAP